MKLSLSECLDEWENDNESNNDDDDVIMMMMTMMKIMITK